MNAKLAISLILGLVFQLAQVLPAAVIPSPCQTQAHSCACCPDASSCDCAENDTPDKKPAPAPFTASDLKLPAMKPVETRVPLETQPAPASAARPASHAFVAPIHGYHGVSLSVAFCSFVI